MGDFALDDTEWYSENCEIQTIEKNLHGLDMRIPTSYTVFINHIWSIVEGFFRGYTSRSGLRIYVFHGLVTKNNKSFINRNFLSLEVFCNHTKFLKHFKLTNYKEMMNLLACRETLSKPTAAITFDDGYRNNLIAAEMLARANIRWTLFISTGAVSRQTTIWTSELALLLLHGTALRLELLDKVWSLTTDDERYAAFQAIRYHLKALPAPQKNRLMDELRMQFPSGHLEELLQRFPAMQMLSWEEVRQLSAAGVTIGSHGVEHEIHHAAQPEEVCRFEVTESKRIIEQHIGKPCDLFAYPNGNHRPDSASLLASAGYRLGFTTQPGTVCEGYDPYALPRLEARGNLRTLVKEFYWEPKE